MVHVLGNHEYMGDLDGDAAQNIYNLPNSRRYSVQHGNVYVATINYTINRAELKADLEWLKQDAKASKCKWKVLTMHQPAYYTNVAGSNEMINELVPGAAEEAGRRAETCGLFLPRQGGCAGRPAVQASGNGICSASDQLCRLGERFHTVAKVL